MKNVLLIVILFIFSELGAQVEKRDLFPTPNAAGLGTFGQVPVNLFTGMADVSIPLYKFQSRDLSVPIMMSYHGGGIKPMERATWVGLGWSLQAGGVINRILQDLPDEYINYKYMGPGGDLSNVKNGFFFNPGILAGSNWTNTQTLLNDLDTLYGVVSNSTTIYNSYRKDKAPDEFQFNFLGMNGSFFMGQDGEWKLKCKNNLDFAVEVETGPYAVWNPTGLYPSMVKNCITRFVLTGADGTKYYFGDDKSSVSTCQGNGFRYFPGTDSTSIEFSRMGPGAGDCFTRDGGTLPVSWYLTKIVSISGDEIKLTYTRDGFQIQVATNSHGSEYTGPQRGNRYDGGGGSKSDQVYVMDGVTLSKITGANGSIVFNKSTANVMDYIFQASTYDPSYQYWAQYIRDAYYYEVFFYATINSFGGPQSTYKKLDEIIVKDNSNANLTSIAFAYIENTNNRLFLNSITKKGSDGQALTPYTFTYENIAGLANVPYSTMQVDHWGYYNGVDPLTGLVFQNFPPQNWANVYNSTFESTYTNNRAPDATKMKYGVLNKITFPTGGYTEFIYEPHTYSKYVNQSFANNVFSVNIANASGPTVTAGGLRVAQINSKADANATVVTNTYSYVTNYPGHIYTSSGVLNSGLPDYVDDNTYYFSPMDYLHYRLWSSNDKLPLHYTNGNHITYTSVAEVHGDGGFTVYDYTNHDNNFLNKLPSAAVFNGVVNSSLQEFNCSSSELERGLLLKTRDYNANYIPLRQKDFLYNDDPNRFNSGVRKFFYENKFVLNGLILYIDQNGFLRTKSGPPALTVANIYAIQNYVHYPFLKKITETNYDQDGQNASVVVNDITHDNYRNVKTETLTSSKGEQIIKEYKYPPDNITGLSTEAADGKNAMFDAHMIRPVLEQITNRAGVQIEKIRNNYKRFQNVNSFPIPANRENAFRANNLDTEVEYVNYDSKGNILQYNSRNNIPNSFQWDYNQSLPTVKIVNAANSFRQYSIQTVQSVTSQIVWYHGQFHLQIKTFNHVVAGDISLSIAWAEWPGTTNKNMNMSYTLTGPSSQSGTICIANYTGGCPPNRPTSITFPNMSPGEYTLSASLSSDYAIGMTGNYSYMTNVTQGATTGIKEFFYEGFEEQVAATVTPYAGNKYYADNNGDYTVAFTPPNARSYMVNYHYLDNGVWKNMTKNYTANMVLTEGTAVDEIRVYPADAFMSTYTYDPLKGMTSETDPNGKTTYYEYDNFQRLKIVRDQEKNIARTYEYKFKL